jgi:segregation and condensation protein B
MVEHHDKADEIGEEPVGGNETPAPAPVPGPVPGPVYANLLDDHVWQEDSAEPDNPDLAQSSSEIASSNAPEATHDGQKNVPKRNQMSVSSQALPARLERIIEAMLFVGGGPLTLEQACAAVPATTPAEFLRCIDVLNRSYRIQGRPYSIRVSSSGCELALRPRFRPLVEKMYGTNREARLSAAALDVLSLVAYRQPLTTQDIDAMRGAESGGILRQLVRRGLLTVEQTEREGKSESVYRTTRRFVEFFQLRGLEDLPQTQDLQRL